MFILRIHKIGTLVMGSRCLSKERIRKVNVSIYSFIESEQLNACQK